MDGTFVKLDLPEARIAFEKDFKECTLETFKKLCSKYKIKLLIRENFFSGKWLQKLEYCNQIIQKFEAAVAKIELNLKELKVDFFKGNESDIAAVIKLNQLGEECKNIKKGCEAEFIQAKQT